MKQDKATQVANQPRVKASAHMWRALRHRNFRLFVTGQSISLIGTWMTRVATSWLVYRLTHSALLLGVGERDEDFPIPYGRGDEARQGGAPDPREKKIVGPRDIYAPDLRTVPRKGIKVPTRDFR